MKTNFLDKILASRRQGLLEWAASPENGDSNGYIFSEHFAIRALKAEGDRGYMLEVNGLGSPERNIFEFSKEGMLEGHTSKIPISDKGAKFLIHHAFENLGANRDDSLMDKAGKIKIAMENSTPDFH